jgi:flagellar M-ring protein FliF
MDVLNKAYGQVAELFRSMTPGARMTAAMLLVTIVVSLTYLFVFQIHTADEYLFGSRDFSQAELDAMQSAFAAARLDEFEVVGTRIRVPHSKLVDYLQALSQSNFLPQNFDSAIDEALAKSNSIIDSKPLQDYRFSQASQKKFGQVIAALAGIDTATAQFQEVPKGGFPPQVERKATVAVRGTAGRELSPTLVQAVRTAASGWFGIQPHDVTIIDLNGNVTFGGDLATREPNGPSTPYADAKRWYESYWKSKIEDCLAVYPGVVVGVNVELDPETDNESKKVTVDTQPIALESNTYTKTSESRPAAGGRPGAVPNEVPSNTPRDITSLTSQATTLDENREEQVSVAGHQQTISKKASLVPSSVTATVLVPKSHLTKLWHQRNPVAAGTEPKEPTDAELQPIERDVTDKITKAVVRTLPPQDPTAPAASLVEVSSYEDLPPATLAGPTATASALAWMTDNWHRLALFGIGIVSLLMIRSMVRTHAPAAPSAAPALAVVAPPEDTSEPAAALEAPALNRRARASGASLRDELTAMVREDPDAAANVLRTWIGDAA